MSERVSTTTRLADALRVCRNIVWMRTCNRKAVEQADAALAAHDAAQPGVDRSIFDGMEVSMDVSTGDADAENRIFGKVYEVMDHEGCKHGVILLAIESERNFATPPPASQPAKQGEGDGICSNCAELRKELDRYVSNTDAMRAPANKMRETAKLIADAGRVVRPINELASQETLPPVGMNFGAPTDQGVDYKSIIERDRTMFAEVVTNMRKKLSSIDWMASGRGSYEWDDARYQKEFGEVVLGLRAQLDALAVRAADWSNSPITWNEIQAARATHPAQATIKEGAGLLESDGICPECGCSPCQCYDDDAAPAAQAVTGGAIEVAAKAIYDHWEFRSSVSTPAWLDRGNSLKQDRARSFAQAALTTAYPALIAEIARSNVRIATLTREIEVLRKHCGDVQESRDYWSGKFAESKAEIASLREDADK